MMKTMCLWFTPTRLTPWLPSLDPSNAGATQRSEPGALGLPDIGQLFPDNDPSGKPSFVLWAVQTLN